MTSRLLLPVVVVVCVAAARDATAQPTARHVMTVRPEASAASGWLDGIIEDDRGITLEGVSVLAVGPTFAAAMSDSRGRFSFSLPPGTYLLRADREDYFSALQQPLVVRANGRTERLVRLTRLRIVPAAPGSAVAEPTPSARPGSPPDIAGADENHAEVAWRLRHLTRTVLRDIVPRARSSAADTDGPDAGRPAPSSPVSWFVQESARATTAWFANTDFTGQVNLVSINGAPMNETRPSPVLWSRSAADLVIGAAVGTVGDWSVRGAVAAGDASSWTILGEYQARDSQRHSLRMALSYSTQGVAASREVPAAVTIPELRSVGGVRVSDRWRLRPSVDVRYGARFDRYGYLAQPNLFSPWVTVHVHRDGRLFAEVSFADRMVAPGEDQFSSPSPTGPWLPPTRTFSALSQGTDLVPERTRQQSVAFGYRSTDVDGPRLTVEWLSQATTKQLVTLFGVDDASQVGHYYIGSSGDVTLAGWRGIFDGAVMAHVGVEWSSRWPTRAGSERDRCPGGSDVRQPD